MAVNVTPLHDRVLVRRIEEKESVKGGIIIPDSAKEKPQEGEVVAVGAGKIEKRSTLPRIKVAWPLPSAPRIAAAPPSWACATASQTRPPPQSRK